MAKKCVFGRIVGEMFCEEPGIMMLKGNGNQIECYCEPHYNHMLKVALEHFANDPRLPRFLARNGINV